MVKLEGKIMLDLNTQELQKLVLMTGSKSALGTYLGIEQKELDLIWRTNSLKTPTTWFRDLPRPTQLEMLATAGSIKVLAKKLSCSESALRPILMGEPLRELPWTLEHLLEQLERYKSVRLVAHMAGVSESLVRKLAEKHELDLSELTDYSFSNHPNGKGRRAELEFQKLRGERVTADRNKIDGPQALYDFDDTDFGKVNVKSSRMWKYTSRSRAEAPHFWKISTRGLKEADTIVCMCYDKFGKELEGIWVIKTAQFATSFSGSLTILRRQLENPETLRYIGA